MTSDPRQEHVKQVDDWIQRNAQGLPAEKLAALFGEAVQALWGRASVTLSDVTLLVIFERAWINSRDRFPLLGSLKIDAKGVGVGEFVAEVHQFPPSQVNLAFRCLLIELMTIVGNLTAHILTEPLYRELSLVAAKPDSSESSRSSQESKERTPDREIR